MTEILAEKEQQLLDLETEKHALQEQLGSAETELRALNTKVEYAVQKLKEAPPRLIPAVDEAVETLTGTSDDGEN